MAGVSRYFNKNYMNLEVPFTFDDNLRLWKIVLNFETLVNSKNPTLKKPIAYAWKTIAYCYNCYSPHQNRTEEVLRLQYKHLKAEHATMDPDSLDELKLISADPVQTFDDLDKYSDVEFMDFRNDFLCTRGRYDLDDSDMFPENGPGTLVRLDPEMLAQMFAEMYPANTRGVAPKVAAEMSNETATKKAPGLPKAKQPGKGKPFSQSPQVLSNNHPKKNSNKKKSSK